MRNNFHELYQSQRPRTKPEAPTPTDLKCPRSHYHWTRTATDPSLTNEVSPLLRIGRAIVCPLKYRLENPTAKWGEPLLPPCQRHSHSEATSAGARDGPSKVSSPKSYGPSCQHPTALAEGGWEVPKSVQIHSRGEVSYQKLADPCGHKTWGHGLSPPQVCGRNSMCISLSSVCRVLFKIIACWLLRNLVQGSQFPMQILSFGQYVYSCVKVPLLCRASHISNHLYIFRSEEITDAQILSSSTSECPDARVWVLYRTYAKDISMRNSVGVWKSRLMPFPFLSARRRVCEICRCWVCHRGFSVNWCFAPVF